MHEKQYREYKSGLAKEQFNKELAQKRGVSEPTPSPFLKGGEKAESQESRAKSQDDDLAAVAYALYLAGKKPKEGTIALPRIKPTAWNHKFYTLK